MCNCVNHFIPRENTSGSEDLAKALIMHVPGDLVSPYFLELYAICQETPWILVVCCWGEGGTVGFEVGTCGQAQ